jgi:hypothetical protein
VYKYILRLRQGPRAGRLGIRLSPLELLALVDTIDRDMTGLVSLSDFMRLMSRVADLDSAHRGSSLSSIVLPPW